MGFDDHDWLSRKPSPTSDLQPRQSAQRRASESRYHADSIRAGDPCCEAARQFGSMRLLSAKAPALPLPGCNVATCTCRYSHFSDRRSGIEIRDLRFFRREGAAPGLIIILTLYFLYKRFWLELAMLLIGAGGGAVIWFLLIDIFDRHRPADQLGIVVTDHSFPSGHAITAVLFYGFLAYLFIPKMPSPFWKWLVGIASVVTMIYIGFSRLFLGGHYLTDILAGYALSLAWAGLVFTLLESLFLKRAVSSAGKQLELKHE